MSSAWIQGRRADRVLAGRPPAQSLRPQGQGGCQGPGEALQAFTGDHGSGIYLNYALVAANGMLRAPACHRVSLAPKDMKRETSAARTAGTSNGADSAHSGLWVQGIVFGPQNRNRVAWGAPAVYKDGASACSAAWGRRKRVRV
jgi:hypothetical protein